MKAMIVGKVHKSGADNKTGEFYNYTRVHVTHKALGVEGQAVDTFTLQARDVDPASIVVGQMCDFSRDSNRRICSFELLGE